MSRMMGMWGIWVGMIGKGGIRVVMRGIGVGMWGIRVGMRGIKVGIFVFIIIILLLTFVFIARILVTRFLPCLPS